MTSSYRSRSWTLLVSVVLHTAGIAFLLTLPSAESPRARPVRIALIAPLYFDPPLAVDPAPAAPKRSLRATIRHVPRSFHLPDLPPQPARPQLTLILPGPPSLHPPDILPPVPLPGIPGLPPAPVVRPAGFSAMETSRSAPVHRMLAPTQAFDTVAGAPDKIAPSRITSANFGDASVSAAGAHPSPNAPPATFSAAEIRSKPHPAYTDEARRLRIEGEVLLEVLFGASGDVRVLRVIRGLGHGLNENAISAAREIQFRPAQRGGLDVDSTAVVHIVFQLAY